MQYVVTCTVCGLGVNLNDPLFHEERYAHTPEWDESEDEHLSAHEDDDHLTSDAYSFYDGIDVFGNDTFFDGSDY